MADERLTRNYSFTLDVLTCIGGLLAGCMFGLFWVLVVVLAVPTLILMDAGRFVGRLLRASS